MTDDIEYEIAFLKRLSKSYRNVGYGELMKTVNESSAKTNDIRETVKETGIPFSLVWDMTGYKDYFDLYENED